MFRYGQCTAGNNRKRAVDVCAKMQLVVAAASKAADNPEGSRQCSIPGWSPAGGLWFVQQGVTDRPPQQLHQLQAVLQPRHCGLQGQCSRLPLASALQVLAFTALPPNTALRKNIWNKDEDQKTWTVKKNTYLMWQYTMCEILVQVPILSNETTVKQQLDGEKWKCRWFISFLFWCVGVLCSVLWNTGHQHITTESGHNFFYVIFCVVRCDLLCG